MPRAPDGIAALEMQKAERLRELERSRKPKPDAGFVDLIAAGALPGVHFNASSMVEMQRRYFLAKMESVKRQETLNSISDLLAALVLEMRDIKAALSAKRRR